jgi:predicted outer membrane repeat protein
MRTESILLLGLVSLLMLFQSTSAGRSIYVDANTPDNNDGSSWAKAYRYLQDALADANSSGDVNEIRVAQGVYTPDTNSADPNGSGDRWARFLLINGVALRGGYAGFGGSEPNVRDIGLYETILSGDLDGNDVDVNDPCDLVTEPTRGENSFHVVTGSHTDSNTVLDGFTITGGNANGIGNNEGAGMYNNRANLIIIDCVFRDNSASDDGGGMLNRDSNIRLISCQFIRNAVKGDEPLNNGGGVYDSRKTRAEFINCLFSNNFAERLGGAVCEFGVGASFNICTFIQNTAGAGGGVYASATTSLVSCDFENNCAIQSGGGLNTERRCAVNDCNFVNNSAGGYGGGMCNTGSGRVFRSKFNGNKARFVGGAIYTRGSIIVESSTIIGNRASMNGGAACSNDKAASMVLSNCTLADNTPASGKNVEDGFSWMSDTKRKNSKKSIETDRTKKSK